MGRFRISTLIELAREYNVELPSYTEEGLRELVLKDRYNNLGEYLKGFQYTVGVLQSEVALERCAYELAIDNQGRRCPLHRGPVCTTTSCSSTPLCDDGSPRS